MNITKSTNEEIAIPTIHSLNAAWHSYTIHVLAKLVKVMLDLALFSSKKFCKMNTVELSFVFDKYCPNMD